jgi:hypothetical protein
VYRSTPFIVIEFAEYVMNAESKQNISTIAIKKKTKVLLASHGKFGQSFDDIIFELIKKMENKK